MNRSVYWLLLIFSVFIRGLSSSSAVTHTVSPGENITLNCSISPGAAMVWYQHSNNELAVIISAVKPNLYNDPAVDYNKDPKHFRLTNTPGHAFPSLIIVDIRQSDIGLYYCGARQSGVMNFTRAAQLQFTSAVKVPSRSAWSSNVSVSCWAPLVVVCCAFTLSVLCLGVVYRRGLSSSACVKCVKDEGMKETDLHYASLKHNADPRARDASSANHNVTYAKVARKVSKTPSI